MEIKLNVLTLSRKKGQKIYLYPEGTENMTVDELFSEGKVELEVVKIEGDQVKLGFNAPKLLRIVRDDANPRSEEKPEKLNELFNLKFVKDELIFISGILLSLLALLTVGTTGYWALCITLFLIIATATYFSRTFFARPSIQKLYFYFLTLLFLIGYFALIYKSFGVISPDAVTASKLNWLDAIYFSVITWTTLGYGDFHPGSDQVKIFVMLEALLGYIYMSVLVGKLMVLGASKSLSKL